MTTERYSLTQEPISDVYRHVLSYALKPCNMALVVVRPDAPLSPHGTDILLQLKPFIRNTIVASEWPGTRLINEKAAVHYFTYDPASSAILQKRSTRLFQWVQPDLPEDLCLLKANGEPWLVSIAHEQDAYFVLEEGERVNLVENIPELQNMMKKDRP